MVTALLFEAVPHVVGSRMTSVWHHRRDERDRSGDWALMHFVELGADQHVEVEGDFLSSHLPFSAGGIGGVFPNGKPWLLVLQQSVPLTNRDGEGNAELGAMDMALWRALRHNLHARVDGKKCWHRRELLTGYEKRGADAGTITPWSTTDLLVGLLANCCGPTLADLARGYSAGCAFPDQGHTCQLDVFDDTFVRWQSGRIEMDD
jgi:hypothetical protein